VPIHAQYLFLASNSVTGTGVAGIIGATHNTEGIAGVVDGKTVCWLIARVFKDVESLARMSDILDGIEWAVERGARIVNLSLGGGSPSVTSQMFFQTLYKQGIIVVGAAGNDGSPTEMYPASYDSVLSVAGKY